MTVTKILVAHDFSDGASRALRFAARLAKQTQATLALVYVHPEPYDGRSHAPPAHEPGLPGQEERYMQFLQAELRSHARDAVPELPGELPCYALRGDPLRRVLTLRDELGADVICLGATGKGAVQRVLLGSVSQSLLRNAPVPVLLVP